MADDDPRRDDDQPDEPRRPSPPTPEGVRIIGAEEARAAYEEQAQEREARREAAERRTTRPTRRFPLPEDEAGEPGEPGEPEGEPRPQVGGQVFGESPSASRGPVDDRPTGAVPMPHWTEPPTGESPTVGGREEPAAGPQARYRDTQSDWTESDFRDLAGDEGEPGRPPPAAPRPGIEDDEAFARQVEERRRQARAARRAGGVAPPPAPGVPPSAPHQPGPPTQPVPAQPSQPPPPQPPQPGGGPPRGGQGMLEPGMPEPPPPSGPPTVERDLATAVVTGVAMGVAALLLFNWGRGPTAWLVALIAVLAGAEFYAVLRMRGYRPAAPLGLAACGGIVLASYDRGFEGFTLVIGLASITTLVWFLIRAEDARPTINAGLTLLGIAYVGALAAFGGLLLGFPNGVGMLLGVVITGVAYDVFGYFVGSRAGTHYLAPSISPNKTAEGLVAGFAAAILAALIFVRPIHPWDTGSAFWLGVVVGIAAPLGDLVESMLKRDIGVKDFGSLIPGHGGVLDRFDAMLFSLPPAFYLVRVLELV